MVGEGETALFALFWGNNFAHEKNGEFAVLREARGACSSFEQRPGEAITRQAAFTLRSQLVYLSVLFDFVADGGDCVCVNDLANFSTSFVDNEVRANGRKRSARDEDFLPASAILINGIRPAAGSPFLRRLLPVHDHVVHLGLISFAVVMRQGDSAKRERNSRR